MFPKVIIGATFLFITVLFHGAACIDHDDVEQCIDFNKSDVGEYLLHQAIKKGLANNSKNLYNIQRTNLKQKSNSKIACLSVIFELLQIAIVNTTSECNIINETKIVLLWTSFDTSIYFGSLLLNYTWYDLRVFGFGWEDDCELYQAPVNISISVDKIPCVTLDKLCSALQYITTMVSFQVKDCTS
jgi:hypothetical protein